MKRTSSVGRAALTVPRVRPSIQSSTIQSPGATRTPPTTIVTPTKHFNYAEFLLVVGPDPARVVRDGRFVDAAVLDLKGDLQVPKLRMVFVKDSPPEKIVRSLTPGARLHVFGLPRINLSEVASRVARSDRHPELLAGNLPYEIVVVGVYEDRK